MGDGHEIMTSSRRADAGGAPRRAAGEPLVSKRAEGWPWVSAFHLDSALR